MELIRAKALHPGDTVGIFTPSSPSYVDNEELFQNGVRNLERLGFKVKIGSLTKSRASQGYRSGTPVQRAQEFMELIQDPGVHGLISTIGGNNSNSLIPYLDFAVIRQNPKVICGYSDVTSLHMAILKYSGLRTFYGPALMTWFGDWPDGVSESSRSFMQAVSSAQQTREVKPFEYWSNHKRDWKSGEWKKIPREWKKNEGWRVLIPGEVKAPLIAANLSTLMSAAGTDYFPDIKDKILLLESMSAGFATEERHLRQLQLMGVFDGILGLIIGKPEWPDSQGAMFSHNDLILEVVGKSRGYPIVSEFDCSHTVPMLTFAQMTMVSLKSQGDWDVRFEVLEAMVI